MLHVELLEELVNFCERKKEKKIEEAFEDRHRKKTLRMHNVHMGAANG